MLYILANIAKLIRENAIELFYRNTKKCHLTGIIGLYVILKAKLAV